jgi:hypothetical protein
MAAGRHRQAVALIRTIIHGFISHYSEKISLLSYFHVLNHYELKAYYLFIKNRGHEKNNLEHIFRNACIEQCEWNGT